MRSAARFMSALLTATLLLPSLLAAPAAAFTTTDPDWSLVDATSPISVDVGSVTVIVVLKQTGGADVGASDGTVTLAVGGSATLTSVVDNGDGTYTSTLSDTTAESVTVHGKIDGSDITDEANVTFSAGALDHIVISPSSASKVANAGQAYTAAGRDQFNNPTGDETGSTTFTISGSGATCAVNVCKATIAGAHTVTGDDGGLQDTATLNVTAAAADHLSVGGFTDPTAAGAAHTTTVTARDSFGNLDTGFAGTVHITSSDPAATLPGNHVYVGGDGGTHGFSMTLNTQGTQSITATDVGTPSINGSQGSINVNAGAVTHLAVTGFADPTIAGVAHTFTVTAQDVGNNTDTTYTGTVHFTSSDGSATLPSNYTFVAGDNGTHTFTLGATFQTSGTQSITATDTGTSSINGAQSGITVNADVAVTLIVSGFTSPTIAGATHSVTVEAQDQFGNPATGYTGTVHFTSNDGAATLPSNYTFVGGDAGTHTFAGVILRTVGSKSITATDIGTPSINGTQSGITVNPGAATHYAVTGFSPGTAGTSDAFSVTVLDAANNTVTGYTGTVHFTSSDGAATLPTNYTFVSGDAGTRLFAATFDTAGTQSITATDTVTASITGSQSGIVIDPGAATHFSVAGFNNPTTAGVSDNFTVTALDAFGNTATGYAGTVHVTSNDGAATLPANNTLTLGTGSFSATLRTSGTRSITATDTVSGSITGAQTGILVNAGTATHFSVTGFNDPAVAGVSDGFIVTALDGLDNIATGYTGQVHFTSSDGAAALPADSTLTSGVKAFTGILKTAGVQSITATDTIAPSINGSQSAIDVTAAAANHLVVSGYPGSTVAGVPHNVTVTAEDAFNNTDLAFAGLVTVTATGGVTHVTPSVATALSSGVGTFSVTFDTVGISRQIAAAASGVTTGSQAGITVTPGAATHFSVTGFGSPITAGGADDLVVTALDALNNTATGYTGTVHLTSSDGQAVLTSNHTFTGGELGVHTFVGSVLKTAGTQSITATDTVTASINGTQSGIVVNPAAADHLTVTGYPSTTVAGDAHNLTVTALDPFDNTDTNYVGTVHFTSTDALGPTLPGNYTFLAGDAGDHLFTGVALHQAGTRSITATDTVTASITGIQSGIVVSPGDATHFAVTSFDDPVVAGVSNTFDVVALDAFGNQATGYTGTMTFTSSDPSATLPSDTTMTNGDGSFPGTLRTVGVQSITITDTISNLITGSQANIDVTPAVTDHFSVAGYPSPTLSDGVSHNVTVTARDAFDNITPAYAGTVHITSSDSAATLPANATLINGVRTFSVTLNTSGNQSITATDTVTASITGAQINIAIDPGPVDHIIISPSTASILATGTQLYLAEGFDAGNNDLGDFTSVTDFSIVGGTCVAVPVSGPNNTCSAVTVGNHTVTGHELTDDVSDTAILTILNTDPVAVDDTPLAILEDASATTIEVLANDTDVNLDAPLLITGATDGALGTVTVNVDGSDLTYTPDADANGSDTFTYDISDGNGGTATATVHITITPINDAPTFAVGTGPTIPEQTSVSPKTVSGFATGMSAGPADEVGSQNLSFTISNDASTLFAVQPSVNVTTGDLTYTPAVNRNGVATVTLVLHDDGGTLNGGVNATPHTFTITVTGSNHQPFAINDAFGVVSGNPAMALPVLANDNAANPDVGEVLHIVNVTQGIHGGQVVITGGGTGLTFKPKKGYIGTDFFTYRVKDGSLFSNYATVLVNVPKDTYKPVATAPVQTIGSQTMGSTTITVHLAWGGTDRGSGIAKFEVWQSTDGHSYKKIKTTTGHSTSATLTLNHTYRFRVRAIDKKGNIGSYAYGPTFKFVRYQETSAVYASTWLTSNSSSYSSGHAKTTSTLGATATLTTVGRTFSWIGVRGSTRGTADVYVDGVLKAHLNLTSSSTTYKKVIYSITFATSAAHAFRIVYTGPTSRRVDLDAIVVLR